MSRLKQSDREGGVPSGKKQKRRRQRHPYAFAEKFGRTGPFGTNIPAKVRFRTVRLARRLAVTLLVLTLVCAACLGASYVWRVQSITASGSLRYEESVLTEHCGLAVGDTMLGFDCARVEEQLRDEFPLLASVQVTRRLDGTVSIQVTDEGRLYYTRHNGNYSLISAESLRIISVMADPYSWGELSPVYLGLPEEARLRKGEKLTYAWLPYPPEGAEDEVSTYEIETGEAVEDFAYVNDVLGAVMGGPLADRVTGLELGDRYGLWFLLDGHIQVLLGDSGNLSYKLSQAMAVLERQTVSGLPAVLDVTDPARVTYREVADLALPSWASQ